MKQLEIDVNQNSDVDFFSTPKNFVSINGPAEGCVSCASDNGVKGVEVAVEGAGELSDPGVRLFFPCNREDALVLLGGLGVSEFYPDSNVALAVESDGVALLESGLRLTEEILLNAGRTENFPVLVEVCSSVMRTAPRFIAHNKIVGLWFRTQSDADDFRLRPVDEFDTETYVCRADPGLFSKDGAARFSIRSESAAQKIGRIADRLVAGVHCVILLGYARKECRSAISKFLSPSSCGKGLELLDFATSSMAAIDSLATSPVYSEHQAAVISAFISADDLSPRDLLGIIQKNLASVPKESDVSEGRDRRWAEVADAVIGSKIALAGELLSDDKSVLLRGALLALVVDNIDSLGAFLGAEKPSGPNVTTLAAFLVGLKQGVTNISWKYKKDAAQKISFLMELVLRSITKSPQAMDGLFVRLEEARGSASVVSIVADGHRLVEWVEEENQALDAVTLAWLDDFDSHGLEVVERGRSSHSWVIRLGGEYLVEVLHSLSGESRFPSFRFYLDVDQKLKRPRDLEAIHAGGARFWYPGKLEGGGRFLFCDLPSLPDSVGADLIRRMLAEALELYLVPKRPVKSRKKKVF